MAEDQKPTETSTTPAGPAAFKLRKPIQAHGKEVSELTFREPLGADLIEVGNPITTNFWGGDEPTLSQDMRKLAAMISRLADIPPSSVAQMHPLDIINAGWTISPFFVAA